MFIVPIFKSEIKKKKRNIIMNIVISSHMGPMYIEASYCISWLK